MTIGIAAAAAPNNMIGARKVISFVRGPWSVVRRPSSVFLCNGRRTTDNGQIKPPARARCARYSVSVTASGRDVSIST